MEIFYKTTEGNIMVISNVSMKGGVGKSAQTILLACNLAARGKKVWVIDLDPNNSSSLFFSLGIKNIQEINLEKNVFKLLMDRNAENNIIPSNKENIWLTTSSIRLPDLRSIDYHVLNNTISKVKDNYDFVIIDTPPTYDNHVMSAIFAADIIFTPVEFNQDNINTARYLREKIMEELPEKYSCWYINYARWESQWENIGNSTQSQFVNAFEEVFENILDGVKIPSTTAAKAYINFGEKLNINSKKTMGNKKLAIAINQLGNLLIGAEVNDTSKYVETF